MTDGGRMLGATDAVNALSLPLVMTRVPADQVVAGHPATGWAALSAVGDVEVGVWEMTAGSMRDTEVDEVFVVLAGAATIGFEDGHDIRIKAGDVVRLNAGERTIWTVTENLRKVYVSGR